jgi:hypothetical protein
MHLGMLWFDNTPNVTLKNRIEKAVNYYRQKYHQEPNLCLINPAMLEKDSPEFGMLTVRSYGPILPGHLWIGVEEKN